MYQPQFERTESALLEAFRNKEDWAVAQVRDRITPLIKQKLYAYAEWEDVLQQCLINIVLAVEKQGQVENFWGFVRKITICYVIDCNRRLQLSRRIFETQPAENDEADDRPLERHPSREELHGERFADRDLFLYVLQRTSKTCRELFRLLFLEDQSYSQAASQLGIREGNLRVRLKRCRDHAIDLRDQELQ